MPDTRPPHPEVEWQWYSLCSAHIEYNSDCPTCQRGSWISDNEREFDSWLWTYSPEIWKKWANRNNVSGWLKWFRKNKW